MGKAPTFVATSAKQRLNIRRVMPALFIILATRIKKGMASRGKLKSPAEIRSGRMSKGMFWKKRNANEESSIEKAIEQFRNNRATNIRKKRTISIKGLPVPLTYSVIFGILRK